MSRFFSICLSIYLFVWGEFGVIFWSFSNVSDFLKFFFFFFFLCVCVHLFSERM